MAVMADKDTGKAKRAEKPARAAASARGGAGRQAGAPAPEAVSALELERNALKAEVAAAKLRIEALEAANAHVVNRIAWMIDSLQALKEGVKS